MLRLSPWVGWSLACLAWVAAASAGPLGPYEPAEGCYLGAYIELDHNVNDEIGTFEQLTGKKHATYFRYVGYGQAFPFRWVKEMQARGVTPHIAWEPNAGLSAVKDDDYLHGWAEAAARTGAPIFLRYASEMNGNWMAYSGDPDLYIAKWRMVYRIMHEVAPNVVMIWCPFSQPKATIPVYYPGDEYVDWVGVNIYNVLHADGDPAKPPSDDPRDQLKYVYDLFAYRKPIAICEYAATHYCVATKTSAVEYAIDNMTRLYSALPAQFPRVRMINWFSVDTEREGLAANNYCLTDNPQILAAYVKLVSSTYFLSQVVKERQIASAAPPQVASLPGAATPPTPPQAPVTVPAPPLPKPAAPLPATNLPLAGTRLGLAPPSGAMIVVQGGRPEALSGRVEIAAEVGKLVPADTATFYVDGRFLAITNVQPFRFVWNASNLPPGAHDLKVVLSNDAEHTVATAQASVIVVTEVEGG